MSDYEIQVTKSRDSFEVDVREGPSSSHHTVTLNDSLYESLTGGDLTKEDCIKAAFHFLLDRESKEMILGRFDVSVISKYFPEFPSKFKEYT